MPRFGGLLSAKCGVLRVSWATVADGVKQCLYSMDVSQVCVHAQQATGVWEAFGVFKPSSYAMCYVVAQVVVHGIMSLWIAVHCC
jgi:hypothetical protein